MRLPDKEAVRVANRLEDVIPALTGEPLSRNGSRESLARCPFHKDGHPSLRVNADKHVWHCDPCHVGGDVFDFVEKHRAVDFRGALAWLADRTGLSNGNGHVTPSATRGRSAREREHVYTDEHGAALIKVVIGGRHADGEKIVWQERPDGRGGWVKGTEGVRRMIYRRPELQEKSGESPAVDVNGGSSAAFSAYPPPEPGSFGPGTDADEAFGL